MIKKSKHNLKSEAKSQDNNPKALNTNANQMIKEFDFHMFRDLYRSIFYL